MSEQGVRLVAKGSACAGTRFLLTFEITDGTGCKKEVLSPFVCRVGELPPLGPVERDTFLFLFAEHRFAEAYEKGLRLLAAGGNSPYLLKQKLRQRGVTASVAEEAVRALEEKGCLSEEDGALREAEKGLAKYWGDRRILAAVRAKGYSEEALSVVRERLASEDAIGRLVELLRKRRTPRPEGEEALLSLAASLVRYGYTSTEIKRALGRYFKEA